MVHGPCGINFPNAPCLDDKRKCTKRFPRAFIDSTQTAEDGYPIYRRRKPEDGGQSFTVERSGITIDNRWVVPYNPVLSRMFNAHINVEYCHSVKSIKYICKYVNKGSDMSMLQLESVNRNDEITMYQLARYVSTDEAIWRIFGFLIHDRDPAVVALYVHLENGQRTYFNPDRDPISLLNDPPRTTLTEFFKLCQIDPFASNLLYQDVITYYTWNQSTKTYTKRKQGEPVEGFPEIKRSNAIGRMYTVHPSQSECFFLRLLLIKRPGPRSFEDLRTFENRVCETYREACQLFGFLEDDNHWRKTLEEAALTRNPPIIRHIFSTIVTNCNPSKPDELWHNFKESMSEDVLNRLRLANPNLDIQFSESIFNTTLIMIEDLCLRMSGKLLQQLGLPSPNRDSNDVSNSEILRETSYNVDELASYVATNLSLLIPDQKVAYDVLESAIRENKGGLYFLDAPGGTGKTFLINLLLASVRSRGDIILATASSGIAATLLEGGRTVHSTFKLPLDVQHSTHTVCGIKKGTTRADMLKRCKAVIWDECTMSHKKSLEAIDRTLRDIRGNDCIFGGITIILSGDFRQTLPVVARGTPTDEINACLKRSSLWCYVKRLHLRTNMRVHLRADNHAGLFATKLLTIGDGTCPSNDRGVIKLTPDLCTIVPTDEVLIHQVFPNLQNNICNRSWLYERAILAPTNSIVNQINMAIQDRLKDRVARTYLSIDTTVEEDHAVHYPTEVLNSFDPPGLPPHHLILKVGSPIMLLRNLDPPRLCNGTRLCIDRLSNNIIEATIISGSHSGESVLIPRIPLIPTDCPVQFRRLQFPIRLAYGITINKSQGQSLKVVGIKLDEPCFSHGQLYVACSRVGKSSNLYVSAPEGCTKNIVYKQALI